MFNPARKPLSRPEILLLNNFQKAVKDLCVVIHPSECTRASAIRK